jgi:Cu2+-exporting ATPase
MQLLTIDSLLSYYAGIEPENFWNEYLMLHLVIMGGGVIGSGLLLAGKNIRQRSRNKKKQSFREVLNAAGKPSQELRAVTTAAAPDVVEEDGLEAREIARKGGTEEEKQNVDHYLKVSVAGLGFAIAGYTVYTPLLIPAVSLVIYSSLPVFKSAKRSLVQGKVKASTVDSITIAGGLVTHYYLASSLVALVYFSAIKLMMKTEDDSKKQLGSIFGEQPRSVWQVKDGVEIELPFEDLRPGDIISIHAGGLIPIDGRVTSGYASVDQHVMTGESQPAEKESGDEVLAGTLVVEGKILIEVEKCGQDTVAAQIGEILKNTADFRSSVEAKSLKLSDQLALPTVLAGGATLAVLGPVSGVALISCNFSDVVRVGSPLGVLNFLKLATEQGILIKDGRSLELLSSVDTVVFDKTGTLTIEQPHVGKVHPWGDIDEDELLLLAAAAEYKQTHPIAKAILLAAEQQHLILPALDNARYEVGYGIQGRMGERTIHVGSYRFMEMRSIVLPPDNKQLQQVCSEAGHSLVYVAIDGVASGAIELHSTLRPEAMSVINELRKNNLDIFIISGDQEKPTKHLAEKLGIDNYFAETLPENKAQLIEQLKQQGRSVCFIGDGINDAIALKQANVSVSLHGASTAATDTAGIILMSQSLEELPQLFKLAKGLDKNMKKSVLSAFVPGAFGAMGVFLFHFGIYTSLMLYVTSLAVGTVNSMTPLLTYRKKDKA